MSVEPILDLEQRLSQLLDGAGCATPSPPSIFHLQHLIYPRILPKSPKILPSLHGKNLLPLQPSKGRPFSPCFTAYEASRLR